MRIEKNDLNDYIYRFTRHCLSDESFNNGGIPSKEEHYKKLSNISDEDLDSFYTALCTLYRLNKKYNGGFDHE